MTSQPLTLNSEQQDKAVCYVRITNENHNGFVEFDFSIGDPQLYVELILPPAAFKEFCKVNAAKFVNQAQADAVDADRVKWREGKPALLR